MMVSNAPVMLAWKMDGTGAPLVILHGLLGHAGNWQTPAKALAADYCVYRVELRNHGQSPHADAMDYPALVADVAAWCQAQQLPPVTLLGHSLGGKVAMGLALTHPELVARLVVVDIAPVVYPDHHHPVLAALQALPLAELRDLRDADARLLPGIADPVMRAFALTNLKRGPDGYYWRLHLPALAAGLDDIRGFPAAWRAQSAQLPTLLIAGADSPYVDAAGEAALRACFPLAQVVRLTAAGHWPHTQQPAEFLATLRRFLRSST